MKGETILSLAVLLGLTVPRVTLSRQSPLLPEHGQGQVDEAGAIGVLNASGRSGAYYIRAGPRSQPIPFLVVLHGTGGRATGSLLPFAPWPKPASSRLW